MTMASGEGSKYDIIYIAKKEASRAHTLEGEAGCIYKSLITYSHVPYASNFIIPAPSSFSTEFPKEQCLLAIYTNKSGFPLSQPSESAFKYLINSLQIAVSNIFV